MTTPAEAARQRGVERILHFTTSKAIIGILAAKKLLSRDDLAQSEYLENVRYYNTRDRSRDAGSTGHISLSVSEVNSHMLGRSETWHPTDVWWVVLAFDPEILDHAGIWFCTTNNVYPVVSRAQGIDGFEAMFAPAVPWGKYGSVAHRPASRDTAFPTHYQAELLYPAELDLSYLRAIYVREPERVADIRSYIAATNIAPGPSLTAVTVQHRPELFVTG